ncbi:uncharacterized protein LOC126662127 [Mercurialis annua]|uniref:uncharacterized protein LOC126662127 n=1 Tax=Mercurialis annua TaxID=3986 RepID=UPI002160C1CB|nr:uncharacterized protein LOC126662127 [Mercurialis annua]
MRPIGALSLSDDCMVSTFIDEANGCWDVEKVRRTFSENDAHNILQLPISNRLPPDKLYWPHDKKGMFTVRSSYYVADKMLRRDVAGPSNIQGSSDYWNKIWSLLQRCKTEEETTLHCLKECEVVRGLWLVSPLNLRTVGIRCDSIPDWIATMSSSLKQEELQLFVMSLWVIWTDRNNIVFENHRSPTPFLFNGIQSMIATGNALKNREVPIESCGQVWIPPPPLWCKINSDVAVSAEKKLSILSAVCRDSSGIVIRSGVSVLNGCVNAEVAEIKAVSFGLQIASDLQIDKIVCEMDALNVANRLQSPGEADDYLQVMVEDCRAACMGREVRFQYVKRSCNQVAHALAKWGIFFGRDCVIDGNVPYPVNELVTVFNH